MFHSSWKHNISLNSHQSTFHVITSCHFLYEYGAKFKFCSLITHNFYVSEELLWSKQLSLVKYKMVESSFQWPYWRPAPSNIPASSLEDQRDNICTFLDSNNMRQYHIQEISPFVSCCEPISEIHLYRWRWRKLTECAVIKSESMLVNPDSLLSLKTHSIGNNEKDVLMRMEFG